MQAQERQRRRRGRDRDEDRDTHNDRGRAKRHTYQSTQSVEARHSAELEEKEIETQPTERRRN